MAKSKTPIEVFTDEIDALAVVQAWRTTGTVRPIPRRVELLRRKNKSIVYRLVGVGEGDSDVIAKGCIEDTGHLERTIYANVLPRLPVTQLQFYGFVERMNDGPSWLFLEDARGVELDTANRAHRELATRWLARLHLSSAAWATGPCLPDRGARHYREHMSQARRVIEDAHNDPKFGDVQRETMRRILTLFGAAEARWLEIESLCAQVPPALIHGDFAERNVQVRNASTPGGETTLFAFDWEVAGWGLPVVDLAHADLRLYWILVRDEWCSLDYATLERVAQVGKLLRGGLAATNWSVPSLSTAWPARAIENMKVYDRRITSAMRAIGWAA